MTTYDLEFAREKFRNAVLEAMDMAAKGIFGEVAKMGATDADLPRLFKAIDEQLEVLSGRFNHPLFEDYIGSEKYMANREALFKLTGHKFNDDALREES